MSIRLVTSSDRHRAYASSSLQQGGYKSLIECLTPEAQLIIRGIPAIRDGRYNAQYEGRGAHRDVYKFSNYILKLERPDPHGGFPSNREEANSLQITADLPQTVKFYHMGDVTIEDSESCTLTVNGLLQGYGGVTYDKLIHKHRMSKLSLQMASFLITAYRELAVMVIDGVQLNIAYADMHSANIATLKDPTTHTEGSSVQSIVVDAEGVRRTQWPRTVFNSCGDQMIADLELQCNRAQHPTWQLLGVYVNLYLNRVFKEQGNDDLAAVREKVHKRFDLLWEAFTDAYLDQCGDKGRIEPPRKHYAETAQFRSPSRRVTQVSLSSSSCQDMETHPATIPGVTVVSSAPVRSKKYLAAPWHQTRLGAIPSSLSEASSYSSAPIATALSTSFTGAVKRKHETEQSEVNVAWPTFQNQHGDFATALQGVAGTNMALQRSSPFRGPDRFQQDRAGRMSWEDRVATDMFDKTPQMSRDQSDDVNRLCHVMYKALHDVLLRCPPGKNGTPQRRVARESEFMKYGMPMRVFQHLRQFEYTERQWFSPSGTYSVVQTEFDLLMGRGDKKLQIHGFCFYDEYERDFYAHMITVSFLACGVLHRGDGR